MTHHPYQSAQAQDLARSIFDQFNGEIPPEVVPQVTELYRQILKVNAIFNQEVATKSNPTPAQMMSINAGFITMIAAIAVKTGCDGTLVDAIAQLKRDNSSN